MRHATRPARGRTARRLVRQIRGDSAKLLGLVGPEILGEPLHDRRQIERAAGPVVAEVASPGEECPCVDGQLRFEFLRRIRFGQQAGTTPRGTNDGKVNPRFARLAQDLVFHLVQRDRLAAHGQQQIVPNVVYTAGRLAYERGNFIVALLEWRSLAERDDARAKLDLARMYFYGQGVPQDIAICERLLREASDAGSIEAQYLLGVREGRGDRGLRWLRKAAGDDDVMAQYYLAARLRSGAQAIDLYHRAASEGIVAAQFDLGRVYLLGRGVTSDPAKTESWWRRAAENGSVAAALALAQLYDSPAYERRNLAEAARWFRIAAERGEAVASCGSR